MYVPIGSQADELIQRARSRIGKSVWRKSAHIDDAPDVFNCYTFVQWLWLPLGVVLPDHILMWEGAASVSLEEAQAADLIFVVRRHRTLLDDDFGHVGVLTRQNTVVHATRWKKGVVEDPRSDFLVRDVLGIRRIRAQLPP